MPHFSSAKAEESKSWAQHPFTNGSQFSSSSPSSSSHQSCFCHSILAFSKHNLVLFRSFIRNVSLECLPNFHVRHKFTLYFLCVVRQRCFLILHSNKLRTHRERHEDTICAHFFTLSRLWKCFTLSLFLVPDTRNRQSVCCVVGAYRKQNSDITKWNVFYLFVHCINQLWFSRVQCTAVNKHFMWMMRYSKAFVDAINANKGETKKQHSTQTLEFILFFGASDWIIHVHVY